MYKKNPALSRGVTDFKHTTLDLLFLSGRSYPTISSKKKRENWNKFRLPPSSRRISSPLRDFARLDFAIQQSSPSRTPYQEDLLERDVSPSEEVSVLGIIGPSGNFNRRGIASSLISIPIRGTSLSGELRTKDFVTLGGVSTVGESLPFKCRLS